MMSLIRPNIPGLNIPFTPPKPRPIKLLSIDGGGIQGMAALVTIRELMRRIQRELGLSVTPLPCEYFDLIAGTGIGGLIAIMLGKLRMSVDEAMDWFQEIVTHVFLRRKSWGDGSFKATTLELVVGRMVLQRAGRVDAQMVDENVSDEGCRTVVCAKSAHTMGNVILFRSYKSFENRAPDCSIVQAVRATTARPGLFKPVDIEDHGIKLSFVDAVFGCNNPTALMLDEAKLIFPDQYVGCIISVGTGQTSTASIPPPRKIGWGPFTLGLGPSAKDEVQALERISTDSERTSQELQVRFQHTPDVYFRFNVEQGLQNTGVADLDKLSEVAAHAMSSNQLVDVNSRLKSAAQAAVSGGALIKTAQLDGSIARTLPKSRVKACPPPSIVFTGQNHIILKIEECFLGDSQIRHVFVLHGLGGSGKTQIALKFVEKHRDVFWDVFYIDASSAERISADLKSIALVKRAGETEDDALTWLAEKDEKWLIVFDNADNTSLDLRKYFPACAHGDILITTRNRQMINMVASESQLGNKDECQVSGMLLEDAKELLLKTSGAALDGTTEEYCVTLVEEFGHLALAIIQAGAYIRVNECTVQEYSEMYKRNKLVLEESRKIVPQIDNYAWTVYTTWRISYDQLKERVAEFLRMLGFMHHDGISETFFQNACERLFAYQPELLASPEDFSIKKAVAEFLKASFCGADNEFDKPAFLDVIRELRSYSLVDFNPYDRTYSVHSLLHDWVRRLDAENAGTTRSGVGLLLALSVRYDAQSQIRTSQQRQLLPHIDTLLADFNAMPCTANSFAWVYQQNQQWIAAESLLTVALEASERILGKAHPTTLYNLENLAATVSYQERWSEVETLRLKAIDTCKQALGTDHAHTLWAMANLATHYSTQKQFQKAELLQSRIVDIKRRTFGPNHSDTLQSMSNLAITYVDLDQFQKAEDLQRLVADSFRQCAGPQHPNTLTSKQALAWTWAKQKKWVPSHILQKEVTDVRSAVLGEGHRDTLESMGMLAGLRRLMPKWRSRRASSTKEDSSSESTTSSAGLPLPFQTKNKTPSVSSTLPHIRVNSPSESSICSSSDTESFKSFGPSEENLLSNNRDELKNGSRAQSTTVSNNDVPQNAQPRSPDLPMSELLAASYFSSPPAAETPLPFSTDFTNIVPISAIFPNYTISPHITHSYSSSRSYSPISHHSPSRLVRPKSSFTDRSIGKKKVLVEPVDDIKDDQSVGPLFYSNSDREGSVRSKKSRDVTVVSTSDEESPLVRPKSPFTDLINGNGKASDKPADSSTENQRDEPLFYSNSDGEALHPQQLKREPMKSEKSMAVTVVSVSDEDD